MQQVSLETADSKPTLNTGFMVALGVLALAVVVLYLSAFKGLVQLWWESDDYFYGFFVIPFSLFLAWDRREMLEEIGGVFKGSWWGLVVVLAATAAHWYGAYHYYFSIEAMTIAPTVLGIVLLVGGWKAIRWLWPSILFLALMVPLPSRYATLLRGPLQEIATKSSVFILQTLGIPAVIQGAGGNVIVLPGDLRIGVVEACSGIRMLMLFFAACIGTALIIRRDAVTRTIVVFSAIPIAIISKRVADYVNRDFVCVCQSRAGRKDFPRPGRMVFDADGDHPFVDRAGHPWKVVYAAGTKGSFGARSDAVGSGQRPGQRSGSGNDPGRPTSRKPKAS